MAAQANTLAKMPALFLALRRACCAYGGRWRKKQLRQATLGGCTGGVCTSAYRLKRVAEAAGNVETSGVNLENYQARRGKAAGK
jgi:hypothetical protein